MINLTGYNRYLYRGVVLLLISAYPIGDAHAGEPEVRLPRGEISISDAIKVIEGQTGYIFSYDGDLFNVAATVTFSRSRLTLKQALEELIGTGDRVACMIRNRYIIIHPKETEGGCKRGKSGTMNYVCTRSMFEQPDAPPPIRPERQDKAAANEQANETLKPSLSSHTSPDFFPGNLSHLPVFAFKSNLLYAAGTLTPNLAVEFGVGDKTSLVFSGSYNPWKRPSAENQKLIHWVIRPEFRYWLYRRFDGHYFGGNVFHVRFNVGGREIPLAGFKKKYRYEGKACGIGANWGYQLPLGVRWGVEFSAGMGIAYIRYDRLDPAVCSDKVKWYTGPTHAALNIVYIIY